MGTKFKRSHRFMCSWYEILAIATMKKEMSYFGERMILELDSIYFWFLSRYSSTSGVV